jgi:hypothetical protein
MIVINYKEIICLSILFTVAAYYLDIHRKRRVFSYMLSHLFAIFISVLISKILYDLIQIYRIE